MRRPWAPKLAGSKCWGAWRCDLSRRRLVGKSWAAGGEGDEGGVGDGGGDGGHDRDGDDGDREDEGGGVESHSCLVSEAMLT